MEQIKQRFGKCGELPLLAWRVSRLGEGAQGLHPLCKGLSSEEER